MATIEATYGGHTPGTAATVGNSAAFGDAVFENLTLNAGTAVYDTMNSRSGNGLVMTQPTAGSQIFARYAVDASDFTSIAYRFYIALQGLPSADANFPCRVMTSAGASCFQVLCRTTGVLRLADTAGGVAASTTAVVTGDATLYRIEVQASNLGTGASNSTLALQLFLGDNVSPMSGGSITSSTVNTTTQGRLLTLGKTSSATLNAWTVDDVKATSGTAVAIGPAPPTSLWVPGWDVRIG